MSEVPSCRLPIWRPVDAWGEVTACQATSSPILLSLVLPVREHPDSSLEGFQSARVESRGLCSFVECDQSMIRES